MPAASTPRLRLVREAAGARFDQLELNALLQRVIVTDDRRAAAEELAQRWTAVTAEDMLASPFVLLGSVDEIVADLAGAAARWGLSYYVIQEPSPTRWRRSSPVSPERGCEKPSAWRPRPHAERTGSTPHLRPAVAAVASGPFSAARGWFVAAALLGRGREAGVTRGLCALPGAGWRRRARGA